MIIDKNYPNIKRLENGDYVINEDLISDENIEIKLDDRLIINVSHYIKDLIK